MKTLLVLALVCYLSSIVVGIIGHVFRTNETVSNVCVSIVMGLIAIASVLSIIHAFSDLL